jgi:hypothetical protein
LEQAAWTDVARRLVLAVMGRHQAHDGELEPHAHTLAGCDLTQRSECQRASGIVSEVATLPGMRHDRNTLDVCRAVGYALAEAARWDARLSTVRDPVLDVLERARTSGELVATGPVTLGLLLLADSDGSLNPSDAWDLGRRLWSLGHD